MKTFEKLSNMCYSSRLKMKSKIKYIIISVSSALGTAAIVAGLALTISHANSNNNGQGGLETPGIPEVTEAILDDASLLADSTQVSAADDKVLSVTEDLENTEISKDLPLSYTAYRVRQGDMIGYIADSFGVTQDTLISVNNIKQTRLIQIGQYLKIPNMPGILYTTKTSKETPSTIAQKYNVDAQRVAFVNHTTTDASLKSGTTLFVPGAEMDWVTRQEINGDLFKKPLRCRYRISSWFGWRTSPFDSSRRSYHGGIDMACATGNYIYPAMAGKVTTAGWSNVYGNYVIVTHHSGYKTLYGHMSAILTTKGSYVTTDSRIGRVGSTGLSTGPHLHFTVYKNGKSVNPANLWN